METARGTAVSTRQVALRRPRGGADRCNVEWESCFGFSETVSIGIRKTIGSNT